MRDFSEELKTVLKLLIYQKDSNNKQFLVLKAAFIEFYKVAKERDPTSHYNIMEVFVKQFKVLIDECYPHLKEEFEKLLILL
jgi:hypothetical protein